MSVEIPKDKNEKVVSKEVEPNTLYLGFHVITAKFDDELGFKNSEIFKINVILENSDILSLNVIMLKCVF